MTVEIVQFRELNVPLR